jgi:sugar lactone lactonase YvrE
MTMKAEPFVRGLNFGEGLRWHDSRFWYSDFFQYRVSSVGADGHPRVELEIEDRPSGLGWLPDGQLLVVAMTSQRVLRRAPGGRAVLHADLKGTAKFHTNDMIVDAHGNAFVGCFGFDIDAFIDEHGVAPLLAEPGPPKAPIMRVTASGKVGIASADHRFPNGMAIIGNTLVVAETVMPGFTAFDLLPDGTLANRRIWAALPKEPLTIAPDGICADSEGAIWAANAIGHEAVRIAPGGEILERVETSQFAYACTLGGTDGRQLLIATAPTSNAGVASKEANGILEIAQVRVPA